MKAIVIEQYGGKENLREREVPTPIPKEGQILIEMNATSINPIDWKVREGYLKDMLPFDFPIILGWDAAGTVKVVGPGASKFAVGERVFVRPETTRFGCYAEYIVTEESLAARIPENISFEEAASIPLAGLTAWQALFDAGGLEDGGKVLIHAGSGGVGSLAIQLAREKGAHIATTASSKNHSMLKELGADICIDYKNTKFEEVLEGYDLVFDTMGGSIQSESYKVLKNGGRLVSIVEPPNENVADQFGVNSAFVWLKPDGKELGELAGHMKEGKLKPIVGHTFDFTEAGLREAHALSESHHAKGKIVIKIKE
ncbi:NADP-dependent oxidoreductase [Mesobacillus zeae]|uniref:NADP-dependent oxidoreductase n=1 Tax=Mesobacillus zeae TaxID=1917180 RepID=A0A398BAE3_9BACI|nr:NADP-dependent oxidoreductase [Mesobacillus zeae]RID85818.1 NADP-dependent oxidoreductase [Mesobacillus zeae]